jgi:flavin reductase (DIM6/NTAB) family NADH-FMN oxidoreductase RutF
MRVHLTDAGTISLMEPDVFQRLDILADPQSPQSLEQAISRIGRRADDSHVWLAPAVLRFLCTSARDTHWESSFQKMLAYAASRGWVHEDGHVRAHLVTSTPAPVVEASEFKAAMRALPAGVSVITTGTADTVAGMVVSSLTSVSAQPPMVAFFVHRASSMYTPLLAHGRFAANVLGARHQAVMATFLNSRQGPERFASGTWISGETGLPVLADAQASLECDIVCTQGLGTHDLVVGKVLRTSGNQADAMVHFNAGTHVLAPQVHALAEAA